MKLFIIALALVSASAFGANYKADPGHTNVNFTVRHMFSKVTGEFKQFEGTFAFDEKAKELKDVNFTIQSASINTNNEKRDGHLKSADFFDAEKIPTLTFKQSKPTKLSGTKGKLAGEFTMHGVTKPVTFDVEYLGTDKDPWGNTKSGFTATAKVSRKDFGLVWNKTLESGKLLVGDEVTISLQVEADAQK